MGYVTEIFDLVAEEYLLAEAVGEADTLLDITVTTLLSFHVTTSMSQFSSKCAENAPLGDFTIFF